MPKLISFIILVGACLVTAGAAFTSLAFIFLSVMFALFFITAIALAIVLDELATIKKTKPRPKFYTSELSYEDRKIEPKGWQQFFKGEDSRVVSHALIQVKRINYHSTMEICAVAIDDPELDRKLMQGRADAEELAATMEAMHVE